MFANKFDYNLDRLPMTSLNYFPKNEGERAHYVFNFQYSQTYLFRLYIFYDNICIICLYQVDRK